MMFESAALVRPLPASRDASGIVAVCGATSDAVAHRIDHSTALGSDAASAVQHAAFRVQR